MSLVEEGVSLAEEGVSPVEEGVSLVEEGVSPVEEGVSPVEEGVSPVEEGVSPVEEGVSPVEEGVSLVEEGVSLVEEGVSLVEEGVSLVEEGVSPAEARLSGAERGVETGRFRRTAVASSCVPGSSMRPSLVLALVLAVGATGAAACAERRFAGPPPPESAAPPPAETEVAVLPPPDGDAGAPGISWIDAVRLERWPDAVALLEALPEAVRARPEMRYVRARAAIGVGGVGDGTRALALLEGLDAALPLVASDLQRWRAEAQLLSGPFAPAAAYFARAHGPRDLVRAAGAYVRAGDLPAARATIERAVIAASHSKTSHDEVVARMKRAEIARAQAGDGADAAADLDLRWVATHAGSTPEGREAAVTLDRMKRPLSARERLAAQDPADQVATTTEPAKPSAKPERPVAKGEAMHAHAMALYRAREYAAAAIAFREAAAAGSGHEAEDLHYAARSLSRADKDAEALKAYHAMAARYPRSPFAEKSEYYAARLMLIDGNFKQAAEAYSRYLASHPKADHRDEAEYERALAWLSSGAPESAKKTLATLARKGPEDRSARLRELYALAMDRAGDRPGAVAMWTDIARTQPLTWAALMARARLAGAGAPVPPLIDPAASTDPKTGRPVLELKLPAASAMLASIGLDGDAEAYLNGAEREVSAPFPGRESEALCGLYGMLSRARRRYRVGINGVEGSWLLRAPSADERWAWDCLYPRPFAAGVRAVEAENGLPRGLVYAVMRQESAFDPAVVSPAAAVGLMQLIPPTARQVAGELSLSLSDDDLTRPDVNLRLGAFYIAKLLKMFEGSVVLAAAAYNAGPRAVSHWVESASDNDVDLWVARIPFEETRTYVARVAQNMARYQWLEGGDEAVTRLSLSIPTSARAPADAY